MIFDPKLGLNQVLTHDELRKRFSVGTSGGIRRSLTNNCLVIISDHIRNLLYDDRWEKDTLLYTGVGSVGNQSLDYNQNPTLAQSNQSGITLFLFEVFKTNQYMYRGIVELSGEPFQERQPDENGIMRNTWMFPLKLKTPLPVEATLVLNLLQKKERIAKKSSLKELVQRIINKEDRTESVRSVTQTISIRDQDVVELTRQVANGVCQLCDKTAPFNDAIGRPYLECHHIEWLRRGGLDHLDNTVALCPNCHRRMHVLDLPDDVDLLKAKAKGKISKILL